MPPTCLVQLAEEKLRYHHLGLCSYLLMISYSDQRQTVLAVLMLQHMCKQVLLSVPQVHTTLAETEYRCCLAGLCCWPELLAMAFLCLDALWQVLLW